MVPYGLKPDALKTNLMVEHSVNSMDTIIPESFVLRVASFLFPLM